jgi:hypothetical protein
MNQVDGSETNSFFTITLLSSQMNIFAALGLHDKEFNLFGLLTQHTGLPPRKRGVKSLDFDLPPASHTKVMAVSPQILENCGYEDHTIYR